MIFCKWFYVFKNHWNVSDGFLQSRVLWDLVWKLEVNINIQILIAALQDPTLDYTYHIWPDLCD